MAKDITGDIQPYVKFKHYHSSEMSDIQGGDDIDLDTVYNEECLNLFPFVCGLCQEPFCNIASYFAHFHLHQDIEPYLHSCETPGKHINDDGDLETVIYKCGKCRLHFPSVCNLFQHVLEDELLTDFVYRGGENTAYPFLEQQPLNNFDHWNPNELKEIKRKMLVSDTIMDHGKINDIQKTSLFSGTSQDLLMEKVNGFQNLTQEINKDDHNVMQTNATNGKLSVKKNTEKNSQQIAKSKRKSIPRKCVIEKNRLMYKIIMGSHVTQKKVVEAKKSPEHGSKHTPVETKRKKAAKQKKSKIKEQSVSLLPPESPKPKPAEDAEHDFINTCNVYEDILGNDCDAITEGSHYDQSFWNPDDISENDDNAFTQSICLESQNGQENEGSLDSILLKRDAVNDVFSKKRAKKTRKKKTGQLHGICLVQCEQCDLIVKSNRMENHMSSHGERTVPCDLCSMKFTTEYRMKTHRKSVHAEGNNFTCHECGKSFKTWPYLKQHTWSHREKQILCPNCPMMFSTKQILRGHLFTHADTKQFKCDICGKAFGRSDHLMNHKGYHLTEKNFPCSKCSKTFKLKKDQKKHEMIHLPPKHFCQHCGKGFVQASNMRQHLKTHERLSQLIDSPPIENL